MCVVDWGDSCQIWNPEWRKARKPHRCQACGGAIKAGLRYVRLFTLFDGEKDSTKSCAACWRAAERFATAHDGYQPHPTGLSESLEQCVEEEPETATKWRGLLRGMTKRRQLAQRRTDNG